MGTVCCITGATTTAGGGGGAALTFESDLPQPVVVTISAASAVAAKRDTTLLSWIFIVNSCWRICLGGLSPQRPFFGSGQRPNSSKSYRLRRVLSARDVETRSQVNISSKGRWEERLLT